MKPEIRERIEKIQKGEVPEGYRKTKVGIIPIEWGVVRTNKVLKTVKKAVNVEPNTEYREIGIRSHGKGIFHKKSVQGNRLGNKRVFWVEEKCFIVNIVFALEQAIAMTSDNERGLIASHRFPMYKPKNDLIYLDYLLAFYKSPRGKFQLNLASPGGAGRNKTLGQKEFAQSLIPLPTINEQQKIVEILFTWDKAIELKEKLIEEKKEFKRGLMQKLLTGKVRFSEFTDDWTEYQLKDICKFMKGSGLSKEKLSIYGEKKCILYGELYTTYSEVIQEVKSKTNIVEGVPSQKGDVLIPASTTTSGIDLANATALEENSVLLGGDINILRNDKSLFNSSFLAHYLTHIKKLDIASKAQGITIVHLYGKHLTKIQIEMPQAKEQEKIAQVLSIQDDVIEILTEKLLQLKQQKKGLMQLLLTGIVRVEVN
ncbi:MAG: restriction endonuclease subunit S [Gammaproteobacteria bacterium]|nr:restriction endonuclease subunit S [Gammaproteobacteria bacterium]